MKKVSEWFAEYAVSHQNETNIKLHYICVPVIFFSIIGLLYSIPNEILASTLPFNTPLLENWAIILVIPALVFYARLGMIHFVKMLCITALCILLSYFLSQYVHLGWFCFILFAVAWVGQFYGHKIEGKKPSFLKDLQFLLIGPLWVIHKWTKSESKS